MLWLAFEFAAQLRILCGNADRAGVEMTLAHHDTARGNKRGGGKAEFVCPQQRANHHIAPGAQAANHLHGNAAAQIVQNQRLMGVSYAFR